MSGIRRFDIIEPSPSFYLTALETSIFTLNPCLDLDFISPLTEFNTITDLIGLTSASTPKLKKSHLCLQRLSNNSDRKYTWTEEIFSSDKDGLDRKYKWTAEIKGGGKTKKERNYNWTAEIKGKGEKSPILRRYTVKASSGNAGDCSGNEKKNNIKFKGDKKSNKIEKKEGKHRVVEIQESGSGSDRGAVVLRQAFAKRTRAVEKKRGKKDLSPQDAAIMIQITFRAYLIRRSQALRGLRDLAVAKTKLKELRSLFNNFSYHRRLSRDAEERQRFSEKIIVLLLTVDAIEGADLMMRAAKRSMVDELEAMLDVVDPQPQPQGTRSISMKRRTFDMPDWAIQKELAAGIEQVVRMIHEDPDATEA